MMRSWNLELIWNDCAERATFGVFWSIGNLSRLMLYDSCACWYAEYYTLSCYATAHHPRNKEGVQASELESPNHHRWRKGHLRACAESC